MKKLFFAIALLCGVWMGTKTLSANSASAQTVTPLTGMVNPLTNGLVGFTNTLITPTNLSELQLNDVVALLMALQTNLEETLPELSLITSNVTFNAPSPSPAQPQGVIAPITSNPPSLVAAPTPAVPAAVNPSQGTSFSLTVGTNTFVIDPPTLQALVEIRDDLQRALPVLQALNGTTPTNGAPATFVNPAVTNFVTMPVTNSFFVPLTNQSPFLLPPASIVF